MKKSIILGAVITSFLLSSCSLFKTYSTSAKEVDVYLVDSATEGDKTIEQCKLGSINPSFRIYSVFHARTIRFIV